MKNYLKKKMMLKGFSLLDVMVALLISGILVFLIAIFIRDMIRYTYFISNHQQIRQEAFALANNLLGSIIREAVAINYDETTENRLVLYMDKQESKNLVITLKEDAADDKRQLVIEKEGSYIFLNSPKTYIAEFKLEYPPKPDAGTFEALKKARSFQPYVRVYLAARMQRFESRRGQEDKGFFPWEDPRISYSAMYTLRNYSFSNLAN